MLTVTICTGLPASGKSTWARAEVAGRRNSTKRINKDDLRAMLDEGDHSKTNERFVERVRDVLILAALDDGKHVIVNDTNLASRHEAHIRQLVKGRAAVEVRVFGIEVEDAIRRDLARPRSVGERVIRQMWSQFLAPAAETYPTDPALPTAIIVDLDGTYAHMVSRGPYDTARCETDEVNEVVRRHRVAPRERAADERTRRRVPAAHRALAGRQPNRLHGAAHAPAGDQRKDAIVKRELFDAHVRGAWPSCSTTGTRSSTCGAASA